MILTTLLQGLNIALLFSILLLGIILIVSSRKFSKLMSNILTSLFLTSYLIFIVLKMSEDLKYYAFFFPFLHLSIAYLGYRFAFTSISNYYRNYDRVDFHLSIYYLLNGLVWLIIYFNDIVTIGLSSLTSGQLQLLGFLGGLVFVFCVLSGISMYFITVSFFAIRNQKLIENILMVLIGIVITGVFYGLDYSLVVFLEPVNQMVFFFPDLTRLETIFGSITLFIPYIFLVFNARKTRFQLEISENNGGMIDPLINFRIKLIEFSVYTYLIGGLSTLLLFLLPYYSKRFQFNNGFNQLLSVPFILLLIFSIKIAFQTPKWIERIVLNRSLNSEVTID